MHGSLFNDHKQESLAVRIVCMSMWNNDSWFNFSLDEYKKNITQEEKLILDNLVNDKYLLFQNNKYSITDKFIQILEKFITK